MNRPFESGGIWYKKCPHCGQVKSFADYDKRADRPGKVAAWCKTCRREDSTKWKARNPERAREASRKSAAAFFLRNPERVRESAKRSVYNRLANNPEYRVLHNLRRRLNKAVTGVCCSASTKELLGCGMSQLMLWLESQFQSGMSWDNYGAWHVDHKRPCASFDLTDPAQQRECFHFSNLQPLWEKDNLRKSDRVG